MIAAAIVLLSVLMFYLTIPLLVILHESGHALAFLILTKAPQVNVFIGSYGVKDTRVNFRIGKLHFYFKRVSPWRMVGMCQVAVEEKDAFRKMMVILAGPVFPFVVWCGITLSVWQADVPFFVQYFCGLVTLCTFIGLFTNLIPGTAKKNGVSNDGLQLAFTYKIRHRFSIYSTACQDLKDRRYASALANFMVLDAEFPKEELIIRPVISLLLRAKRFTEAADYLGILEETDQLTVNDYINKGYLASASNQYEAALHDFSAALLINKDHPIVLNNMGYALIKTGQYLEGASVLKKAVKISPQFPEPYNNLGFLKVLTGELEEGKEWLEKGMSLNPANAHAWMYLGFYHVKMKNQVQAETCFKKARTLDPGLNAEISAYISLSISTHS